MMKLKLTKKQVEVIERLNFMLFHKYWPTLLKYQKIDKYDQNSPDFKKGYIQAIWDITFDTSAASTGLLPSNKTIKQWSDKSGEEFEKIYKQTGMIMDWKSYKINNNNNNKVYK